MDNLRDKIAEALEISMDNVNDMDVTFNDFANAGADAILALPEISDLQKKLAEVEAERDKLRLQHGGLINDTVSMGMARDEAEAKLAEVEAERDEWKYHKAGKSSGAKSAEAALARAYQMGLDAAAAITDTKKQQARLKGGGPNRSVYKDKGSATAIDLRKTLASNIRALQPPADLVEQCKKEVK